MTDESRMDRIRRRVAERLNARMVSEFEGKPPQRRFGMSVGWLVLLVVSVVLLLVAAACLVVGLVLVGMTFPSLTMVFGALLLLVAWGLRPRLGKVDRSFGVLTRAEAPAFFALLDKVSAAVKAPTIKAVVVNPSYHVSAGRFGIDRLPTLSLGLPLWGTLDPQQRVALLAHELAHFINGDPTRSLLSQPVLAGSKGLTARARLDFDAGHTSRDNMDENRAGSPLGVLLLVVLQLGYLVGSTVRFGLLCLAIRGHHRAEYLADAIAVRTAGTAATLRLLEDLMRGPAIPNAVRRIEIDRRLAIQAGPGVPGWRTAAAQTRLKRKVTEEAREASIQEAARICHHPALGMRLAMVESWPVLPQTVVFSTQECAQADGELADWYDRVGVALVAKEPLGPRSEFERAGCSA